MAVMAYIEEDYARADVNSSLVAALAIRAEFGHIGGWKIFGEAGGWGMPTASFSFSRDYTNGAGLATGVDSEGDLFYLYGRIGAAAFDTQSHQVVLSVEAAHEGLRLAGYKENSFETTPSKRKWNPGTVP